MAIYKNANLDISVSAEQNPSYNAKPSVQFSTQDKNTAKYTFTVKQNNKPVDLTGVTASVTLYSEDKSVFQSDATITSATEGKIEYVIPSEAIRHHGKTRGDLRLTYPNGDVLGGLRFSFNIEQALIDRAAGVIGGVYIRDFEQLKAEIEATAESIKDFDVARVDMELKEKATKQEVQQVTAQLAEKVSLPANYNLSKPTLVTDFSGEWGAEWNRNNLWFKLGNGTMETDTTNTKHGAKSIKITTNAGSNVTLRKDFPNAPIDIADKMQEVGFWLYVKDHTTISEISLQFFSATSGTYFSGAIKPRISGWNFIKMNGADFTRYGEASWRAINGFAFRVFANSNVIAEVSFDSFEVGFKGIPLVLFTFDDATIDNYTEAYKYMKSKGLKGTIYAVKSWTGTEGYMTEAQLKETNNGGWTIANHTRDHVNVSQQTKEGAKAQVLDNAIWLESIGCIKGSKHVAYPFGKTSDMVDEAMTETGMISGRTYSIYGLQTSPITHKYRLLTKDVLMTSTVDEILAEIDKAHKIGATCILVFHKILETPTEMYDWSIANFRSLVDKVYARGDKCLTIDEWYDGLSSPSYYFSR